MTFKNRIELGRTQDTSMDTEVNKGSSFGIKLYIFPTDEGDKGANLILIQMLGLALNFILEKDSEQTSKSRSGWK